MSNLNFVDESFKIIKMALPILLPIIGGGLVSLCTLWLTHRNQLEQKRFEMVQQKEYNDIEQFNSDFYEYFYSLQKYAYFITISIENNDIQREEIYQIRSEFLECERKYVSSLSKIKFYLEENKKNLPKEILDDFQFINSEILGSFYGKVNTKKDTERLFDQENTAKAKKEIEMKINKINNNYKILEAIFEDMVMKNNK